MNVEESGLLIGLDLVCAVGHGAEMDAAWFAPMGVGNEILAEALVGG
jgi:hypothetical protein